MTPALVTPVPAPTPGGNVITTRSDDPVTVEAHLLIDATRISRDPQLTAFCAGAALGTLVVLGIESRELLDDARAWPRTLAVDFEHLPRPVMDEQALLMHARYCGVRWGYKHATRSDPEAAECTTCGERLMPDDEPIVCPLDGDSYCEIGDCHTAGHGGRGCPVDDVWADLMSDMDRGN